MFLVSSLLPRLLVPTPRRARILPWLPFLLLPLALLGCGGDTAETDVDPPPTTEKPVPATPLRARVFLELSGGMKGFMPANTAATQPTEFQDRISQLASRTRSSPAVADAQFLLALKDTPTPTTYAHFRDVVQGDTHEAALGTELPDMLEKILALPGAADQVSVVVSDFVYGPQNKATTGQMAVLITDALAAATKKQLAVAVLGETSRFAGTFYPAVKTPRKQLTLSGKNGEKLPYYVWVMGPPAAVGRYLNEVVPATAAKAQQAYFGLTFPRVPYAAVLTQVPAASPLAPSSDGSGSISFAGAGVSPNLEVSDAPDGVDFTVALDLSQLPAAWREPAFLNQHLTAQLPDGAVRLLPGSVRRLDHVTGLTTYTHAVRLRLSSLPRAGGQLKLSLPAPGVPAWAGQWSTDNDNQPGARPQTYRLTEIMRGLRDAFPAELPPVFTATFSLAQER